MNTDRRRFIQLAGGGAVFAATAPLAGCSSDYPEAAVSAWVGGSEPSELRRWMLAHALLAPNPHNRQPWIADLSRDGEITLICDGNRLLPETDPFGRQILIGCGAFIELATIAAAERGHAVQLQLFPQGEPAADRLPKGTVVARLVLRADPSVPRDPLFAQIRRRHTNKDAYDPSRRLPDGMAALWQNTAAGHGLRAQVTTAPELLQTLRRITREAWENEMLTPRTWLESAHLLRIGPKAIEQHRDGISIMGLMPRLAKAVGAFDPFEVPVRGSSNFSRVMERWAVAETGSGYLWIESPGNTRGHQVAAGSAYVRSHLQATASGVDMHPLSQALQEFAEVRPQQEALYRALGVDRASSTVQMFARVGYGLKPAPATPRRDASTLVRS